MSEGLNEITESLQILLSTGPGERLFFPLFGLQPPVFDVTSAASISDMRDRIVDTIEIYEPRIRVLNVTADTSALADGKVSFSIEFFVPEVNTRNNIVVPFVFEEGPTVASATLVEGGLANG
ncbi:MAG: GPW/gp25 family protein [Paracoccaceae bacterium]|nr:GPW/gp25 family protein [Paracoccaceae bacterium]